MPVKQAFSAGMTGGYYGVRKYALRAGKQTAFVCGGRQPDKYKEYGQYGPENTEWTAEHDGCVKAPDKRQSAGGAGAGIRQ